MPLYININILPYYKFYNTNYTWYFPNINDLNVVSVFVDVLLNVLIKRSVLFIFTILNLAYNNNNHHYYQFKNILNQSTYVGSSTVSNCVDQPFL